MIKPKYKRARGKGHVMSKERQELILSILQCGKYKINVHSGMIMSKHHRTGQFRELLGWATENGEVQFNISNTERFNKKERTIAYGHHIIWLSANGLFEEDMTIYHKDSNRMNNSLRNLLIRGKGKKKTKAMRAATKDVVKKVRFKQIKLIKKLLVAEPEITVVDIAERLGASYRSTKYAVAKIKNGEPLKYEVAGPYPSPNNKRLKIINSMSEADIFLAHGALI